MTSVYGCGNESNRGKIEWNIFLPISMVHVAQKLLHCTLTLPAVTSSGFSQIKNPNRISKMSFLSVLQTLDLNLYACKPCAIIHMYVFNTLFPITPPKKTIDYVLRNSDTIVTFYLGAASVFLNVLLLIIGVFLRYKYITIVN